MKAKLLLLFLLLTATLSAREVYFKHISREQGLSQLSALSVWQDGRGVMWFGNSTLNKYNGSSVEEFDMSRYTDRGEDNTVRFICGDNADRLYLLVANEILTYDLRKEIFRRLDIKATSLSLSGETLYYAFKRQVFAYHTTDTLRKEIVALPAGTIRHILSLEGDSLLLATSVGVYRVHAKNRTAELLDGTPDAACLFRDSGGRIWVGTNNSGVTVLCPDGTRKTLRETGRPGYALSNNSIRCFEEDGVGSVWVGTYNGVTVVDPATMACSYFKHDMQAEYSLRHNSVYALYKDRQGTMWVGTYYGGISYTNPLTERYRFYPTDNRSPHALKGTVVGKMSEDKAGNLYIGSEGGGISILNNSTHAVDSFPLSTSLLAHHTVKSLWYDREYDRLFIGTFKDGLLVYEKQQNRTYRIGAGYLLTSAQQIIQEIVPYAGNLLLLTQEGIYTLDRITLELAPLFSSPAQQEKCNRLIHTLYVDRDGLLWISFVKDGLCSVDPVTGEWKSYAYPGANGEPSGSPVVSLCEDERGALYIATLGAGIFRYDRQAARFASPWPDGKDNPLLSDMCYSLAVTHSGNLLITSDKGITLLDCATWQTRHIRLGKNFPLKSLLTNSGLHVSSVSGEIYVGGMYGMISFFEEEMGLKDTGYTLCFSSLSVNNRIVTSQTNPEILSQNISYAGEIRLNYDQNNITLAFASSDYASSSYSSYEYKMEGFDSHWVETQFKTVTYSSLPPGRYLFTVREINDKTKTASLRVVVTPPFYASGYAYVFYLLLATGALVWWIRMNKIRVLLKASLEMEHREKLRIEELNQAKLRFFTNISHEFRTPLTLIVSSLEMILNGDSLSPAGKNKLLLIKKHTHRLQDLITELLDFRKQENGKLAIKATLQDMNVFLADIYQAFAEYARSRHIRYAFKHPEGTVNVWFDVVQLQKVFYNLLSNAFKFTSPGGEVQLALAQQEAQVEITVTNVGSEIRPEDKEKIFDRFYQADNLSVSSSLPGSGIGLALSKGILDSHHGQITVESGDNRTSFRITLLLGDAHLKPEEKSAHPAPATWTPSLPAEEPEMPEDAGLGTSGEKRYTILIVEDNEELLHVLKEAFTPIYNVVEAHNGEEGLQLAHERMPNLVLSDIMMPRLSGIEMCRQLKMHIETSHIPVILLTARSSVEQNREGLKYGADDYITKPFHLELLLLKCNNIVKTQQELQRKFRLASNLEINELATNTLDQELLSRSVEVIEANIDNPAFDIGVWSRELAIGRSKLFNKIKAITGLTPNDFILNIKLKKAAVLLSPPHELTVAEISYRLGFSSPGYFGRCFKSQFNVTPLQYRKRMAEEQKPEE